jgi:hypothetical protein
MVVRGVRNSIGGAMRVLIVILAFLLVGFSNPATAAENEIGVIKNIKGPVSIERDKASITAKQGDKLFENDIIITGKGGSMGAVLNDNSLISSGSDSKLILSQFAFNPAEKKLSSTFHMMRGTTTYLSGLIGLRDNKAVKFVTPTAVCGLRGTHLAIYVVEGD